MSLSVPTDSTDIRVHASVPRGMTRANLKEFWNAFKGPFLQCCGEHGKHEFTGGVLASVLPAADFLLHFGVATNTVVPPAAGNFDPAHDDIDVFKLVDAKYMRYTLLLSSVTTIWRRFMDDDLFSALADPDLLLARVSLQDQYGHILASEAITDPHILTKLEEMLNQPQGSQDFMHVLTRNDHLVHLRRGQSAPLSEYDKMKILLAQWTTHPIYGPRVLDYLRTHPHPPRDPPVAGDQLYTELVAVLTLEYNLHRDKPLPVHLAFSATASEPAPSAAPSALQQQVTALSAQLATFVAQGTQSHPAAPSTGGTRKCAHYCHSHAGGDHPSSECLRKFAGHKDAATFTNQMGGTKGKWAQLSDAQRNAARNRTA